MEKLTREDLYTVKAADHFGVDENDVTPKQRQFIKEQLLSENYGHRGIPLRTYSITEEGTVEFDEATSKQLIQDAAWLPPY